MIRSPFGARARLVSAVGSVVESLECRRLLASVFLSDLTPTAASAPFGGVWEDVSPNNTPIRIGGVAYAKGIGVHSPSDVTYSLGGQYARFSAAVGIDDSVGNSPNDGSAQFLVYVDGVLVKTSTRRDGSLAAESIDLDVTGAQTLRLVTNTGGLPNDNNYRDHGVWADAKLDDDVNAVRVGVIVSDPNALEVPAGGLANPGQFVFTRTGDTTAALDVFYTVTGSATVGTDFTGPPTPVAQLYKATIAAGQTSVTVPVNVIDDTLVEGNETVVVTVSPNGAYAINSANAAATVTVFDNDTAAVTVGVVASDSVAGEPGNNGQFTFTRTGSTAAGLDVFYTLGGSATYLSDYSGPAVQGTQYRVTIPAGQSSVTVPITVINDTNVESQETVIATLAATATYQIDPAKTSASVAIADDEPPPPTVTVTATDGEAAETVSGATVDRGQLTFTRTGSTQNGLAVDYALAGTATYNTDYFGPTFVSATVGYRVVIPAGQSSVTVPIIIIDDTASEGLETVVATIKASPNYTAGAGQASGSVNILDNESPNVGTGVYLSDLTPASAVSPFGGAQKDKSAGGAAMKIGGVSYAKGVGVHSPSELVYNLNGQYKRFTASVGIDDSVGDSPNDGSAQFLVYVDGVLKKTSTRRDGSQAAEFIDVDITGAQTLRLVTNTGGLPSDNNYRDHADWADAKLHPTASPPLVKPTVSISAVTSQVNEDGIGDGRVRVQRTGDTGVELRVLLDFSGVAGVGTDYVVPVDLVIPAGQAAVEHDITAVRDSAVEGNEAFAIAIKPDGSYIIGGTGTASFVVIDDDGFSQPPTGQGVFVSDLTPTSAVSPYGGLRKDRSTGGNVLTIGGKTFNKGLGVHSLSDVTYSLGGQYSRFTSFVGIDDETGNAPTDGTAVFEVYVDGVLVKSSGLQTGATAGELIDVSVAGGQTLRLVTTRGGDTDFKDHTDWADAKLFV